MGMMSLGDRASSTEPAGNQWWAVSVGTELVEGKTQLERIPMFIKGQLLKSPLLSLFGGSKHLFSICCFQVPVKYTHCRLEKAAW